MAAQLLIRPSYNDHEVLADLLTPGGAGVLLPGRRTPIDRLVIDAQLAERFPQYAAAASGVGVPMLVDPLTFLWQGHVDETAAWANLPYAQPEPLSADRLANPLAREALIAQVVETQLEHGATSVIAPYVYAESPDDPWFSRAVELLEACRLHMERNDIRLPLAAVLAIKVQGFSDMRSWARGLDRFTLTATDIGVSLLGTALSPASPKDSHSKVARLFATNEHIKSTFGGAVIAWRDGVYGPALVAAGLDGYETGIGFGETCNLPRNIRSRRPGGQPFMPPRPIYLDPLGRSVQAEVARILLDHPGMRARVMCDDERCCPGGATTTLKRPREHAVRSRARALAALDALPHPTWRLHQIAKDARAASVLATQANDLLATAGRRERLDTKGLEAIDKIAKHLRSRAMPEAA